MIAEAALAYNTHDQKTESRKENEILLAGEIIQDLDLIIDPVK